jgi:alpha-tubulin suppressor-like RCC1 family protein
LITDRGRVFSAGFGGTYALGHGNNTTIDRFKEIEFFRQPEFKNKKITSPKCGVGHSVLMADKKVILVTKGVHLGIVWEP